MRRLIIICALVALAAAQAGALADEELIDAALSTDTMKTDEAPYEDDGQAYIQESDEDLAGFVQDYVKKDVILKGSFFLEGAAPGRVLKLNLETVRKKSLAGPNNSKIVEAVFKDAAGKKHTVLFHLQSAGFGGIDIFKIELKKEEKPKSPAKVKKGSSGFSVHKQ